MTREEEGKLREAIMRAQIENRARYQRARRFADTVLYMVRDFVPQDRECQQRLLDHLMMTGFEANAEFVHVPLECDELDKRALERRMLEASMQRAGIIPTDLRPDPNDPNGIIAERK